jgi:hypothetical protein
LPVDGHGYLEEFHDRQSAPVDDGHAWNKKRFEGGEMFKVDILKVGAVG